VLHPGEVLETGAGGKITLGSDPVDLGSGGPDHNLEHAVGALSVPLKLKSVPGHYVRPHEQEIAFTLEADQ
jgi:hypothetical protein